MRLHFFQHEPFERPYLIEEWARNNDFFISSTHFYKEPRLPELGNIDMLVVMGGCMSVNDESLYPWLKGEKTFVRQAIESGKKVIGVCLGAQMIASALGARVYRNHEKEIGWFPVEWKKATRKAELFPHIPDELVVMHWHGETFELPEGAVHLAESVACKNQAFLIDKRVLGLQFHMEFNETAIEEMLANCSHELVKGNYIQTKEEIMEGRNNLTAAKKALISILDALH